VKHRMKISEIEKQFPKVIMISFLYAWIASLCAHLNFKCMDCDFNAINSKTSNENPAPLSFWHQTKVIMRTKILKKIFFFVWQIKPSSLDIYSMFYNCSGGHTKMYWKNLISPRWAHKQLQAYKIVCEFEWKINWVFAAKCPTHFIWIWC
jgi:hypothetical protein